ncbi:MAG: spore coat protein [Candidatus Komeilibacteria bacterium CG_4_9_14_0_8_um_filter_36_9]|uniref:glucose-1-phosphate thymidylyltransferase n=1 Tax=Candidatus Komeilibacteria bacterium CG_4_9_14_0_8_um_filter_36_9 TaxID=1974473 RepID=A0A2M8DQW6_9BACT|nr:MAG: spore coat protein [Candidatus Komeilibacteria bacterium CG_4_9_14_0_8_um_filter_36_9]
MKGIILSGGHGTRLAPLTNITSKQLLPIYDRPMVDYPMQTLIDAGIKDILLIVGPEKSGDYLNYFGSGAKLGINITYEVQDKPTGLPDAFVIGKQFIGDDDVTMILGDNIFEDKVSEAIKSFKSGAKVFAKEVPDPERFGVVKFDANQKAEKIVEKPQEFLSNHALVGLYIYDNRVVKVAENLKPSARGEKEIVDLHNWYLDKGELEVEIIKGEWIDAGTFDSLLRANNFIAKQRKNK